MQAINGKPVLLSGGCMFRARDTVTVGGSPPLTIAAADGAEPTIAIVGTGAGFSITIGGFTAGLLMTAEAKGSMADGRLIVIFAIANRIAELGDGPVYRVDYFVAERAP